MTANYTITIDEEGNGVITVVEDGEIFTVTSTDTRFPLYMDAAISGRPLPEIESAAPDLRPLVELSERVSVQGPDILFDGEVVHDALARTIHRYWEEGRPFGGILRLMERLSHNSCEHTREHLWRWVDDRHLEVDNEGFIIGYKGVRDDRTSVNSGGAFVDDEWLDGHVPNTDGAVVSMQRSKVEHDPGVACAPGLHVGTESYARGFGHGVLLVVRVDPEDIVSVPTDCGGEKMRTCRYKVIEVRDETKSYEPTAADEPGYKGVEERITEAAPEEARSFTRKLLSRFRSKS